MAKDLVGRWEELIRVVMAGGILPFVGAGISRNSWDPGDLSYEPTVDQLVRLMRRGLTGEHAQDLERRGLTPSTMEFSRLAEVCTWMLGEQRLLQVLQPESLNRLLTLPAHRYVARLQREGWIDEVITTNWDTCLERAYRGTFRHPRQADACPAVIRSDHEYQESNQHGSADGGMRSDEPVVRLFKINGCAGEALDQLGTQEVRGQEPLVTGVQREGVTLRFRGTVRDLGRRTLLLTDTQLAQMREDWKRDLFRDRLRAKRLLTSAFGADEPQVRYTVTEIVSRLADPARGPFVQEFLPNPTFPQHQLLGAGQGVELGDVNDRFFGGRDNELVGDEPGPRLPADTFWKRVYQAAIWRRVDHELRHMRSPLRRVLADETGAEVSGGLILRALQEWLGDPSGNGSSEDVRDALFGLRRVLWEELPCPGARRQSGPREGWEDSWRREQDVQLDHSLLIMALVRAARGLQPWCPAHTGVPFRPGRTYRQAECYRPFKQDSVAIGYALLACCAANWPDTNHSVEQLAAPLRAGLIPTERGFTLLHTGGARQLHVNVDDVGPGRVLSRMWTLGPVVSRRPVWVRVEKETPQREIRVVVAHPESPVVEVARRVKARLPRRGSAEDRRRARLVPAGGSHG